MAKKNILRFRHGLHPDEVHGRLVSMVERQASTAGDRETISYRRHGERYDFTFRQAGFTIQGEIQISETEVIITMELPWISRMFQGVIEKHIRKQAAILTSEKVPQDEPAARSQR
ncbi:MAG: polyhydroxyalkanoic acid system family protein [Proteobacteria bacterium]|nr:polyhydroxyalkanoic acid system family protein [Pseudomonadota bacterium]